MALQSLARPPSNENFQWALTDSNRRPSACKADAEPAELNALLMNESAWILCGR